MLWLISASICAHFGFSVVTSGCEVLQLDFCRFWRFYATGQQISGFYDNGVMVQLLNHWPTCNFEQFCEVFGVLKMFGNGFSETQTF